jgi:hypothetical protein
VVSSDIDVQSQIRRIDVELILTGDTVVKVEAEQVEMLDMLYGATGVCAIHASPL